MTTDSYVDLLQVDLLASGASLVWPLRGPRHMKSDEGLFWKSNSYSAQNIFISLFTFFSQCLVPRGGKLFCSCPKAWISISGLESYRSQFLNGVSLVREFSRQSVVLITPRSVSSVGRLDALAVDTNFAKKAEGWVSSCGDVKLWLELMAPKRQGREFDPHADQPFIFFCCFFFSFCLRMVIKKSVCTCEKKIRFSS